MTQSGFPLAPIARFALYAAAVGVGLDALVSAAAAGVDPEWLFGEDGVVETAECLLALIAAGFFGAAARGSKPRSALFGVLGALCLFAALRELDGFFDVVVTKGAYKILAAPLLAAAAYLAWRGRARIGAEFAAYATSASAMLAFAGALIVLVHAQVLGQKQLWNAVAEGAHARIVKKTFEEGSELTGYALIVFAAIEALLWARRAASARSA